MRLSCPWVYLTYAVWKGPTETVLGFGLYPHWVRHALAIAADLVSLDFAADCRKSRSPFFGVRAAWLRKIRTAKPRIYQSRSHRACNPTDRPCSIGLAMETRHSLPRSDPIFASGKLGL